MGFIRFISHNGSLVGVISSKNDVLPLLAPHLTNRYPEKTFILFDDTHKIALIHHQNGQNQFIEQMDFTPPSIVDEELYVQTLWQAFHQATTIPTRYQPNRTAPSCPLYYQRYMPEMPGYEQ